MKGSNMGHKFVIQGDSIECKRCGQAAETAAAKCPTAYRVTLRK